MFWLEPDLAGFRNSNPARAGYCGELVLRSHSNTPDEVNGFNNAVRCYKETVQFSVLFVASPFANFGRNRWNSSEFCIVFT